jgi:methyl-accepting chemotaxis protein
MLKNLKLGLKMTLGFGLVILLVLAIGGLAILNMMQIQAQSESLNQEYVPEVAVANNIERNALMVMYDMRAYGLNFDRNFYDSAQKYMETLNGYLDEAEQLAIDYPGLVQLGKDIVVAKEHVAEYDALAKETRQIVDSIAGERAVLDEMAAQYISQAVAFLEIQNETFLRELADGASDAALAERVRKINLMNDAIDYANNARVATFKAIADFDYNGFKAALGMLDQIVPVVAELNGITRQQANLNQLKTIGESRQKYYDALNASYGYFQHLAELNVERTRSGEDVLEAAQNTASAGIAATKNISQEAVDKVTSAVIIIAIGLAIALLLAVIIAFILTISIVRALQKGVDFAKEIALGNLKIELDVYQKDEIGELADAMRGMLVSLQEKGRVIERIADGDLTVQFAKASDKDDLGESLLVMKSSLTEILTNVKSAIEQVSSGSDQVSQASQELSQGATEQASSLEEITSSVNEINAQSKQNAENAVEANGLAKNAASVAGEGDREMTNLQQAMTAINASSDQIKKVVKVIDDIAFQINLLALNANVEAARAGKYGKGFGVVAEEVRNLAVKSANAVQETTQMVEDSISNIERGNKSVESTAEKLRGIVDGVQKVANFLEEIAVASREQAQGIDQITEGLDQIDQVTQSNTASAEESASASEELAGQAEQLKGLIQRFTLADDERLLLTARRPEPAVGRQQPRQQQYQAPRQAPSRPQTQNYQRGNTSTGIRPVDPSEQIRLDDDDFERF